MDTVETVHKIDVYVRQITKKKGIDGKTIKPHFEAEPLSNRLVARILGFDKQTALLAVFSSSGRNVRDSINALMRIISTPYHTFEPHKIYGCQPPR